MEKESIENSRILNDLTENSRLLKEKVTLLQKQIKLMRKNKLAHKILWNSQELENKIDERIAKMREILCISSSTDSKNWGTRDG